MTMVRSFFMDPPHLAGSVPGKWHIVRESSYMWVQYGRGHKSLHAFNFHFQLSLHAFTAALQQLLHGPAPLGRQRAWEVANKGIADSVREGMSDCMLVSTASHCSAATAAC
jgi:hypothetical protein